MALKDNILMNCEHATSLVEKKRDKKLVISERLGLWVHLAYCGFCALFFEQSRILDESTKKYSEKVTNEQKAYKLNPGQKEKLTKAFEAELKDQNI